MLLVTVLAFAAPVYAHGDDRADVFPHPAPASHAGADTLLRGALRVADTYWAAQGTPVPCGPDLWLYTRFDKRPARAEQPGCRLWVEREYRDQVWATVNDPGIRVRYRRWEAHRLCGLMVHERGHNLGRGHAVAGSSVMFEGWDRAVPAVCWAWAVRSVAKRAKRKRWRLIS